MLVMLIVICYAYKEEKKEKENGTQNTPKRPNLNNFLMKWNERLNPGIKTNCHMNNSMIGPTCDVTEYPKSEQTLITSQ